MAGRLGGGGARWAVYRGLPTKTGGKMLFTEGTHEHTAKVRTRKLSRRCCSTGSGAMYMFAFEIASLLLLVAIIGAVVMAKKRI